MIVNYKLSNWTTVLKGIPQGCIRARIFPDDIKIVNKITNLESPHLIQTNLPQLFQWSEDWQLDLNEKM